MERFEELLEALNVATTAIAERQEEYLNELKAGGLTPSQEDSIYTRLFEGVERLKALAVDPENPVPDEEPVDEEPVDGPSEEPVDGPTNE